MNTTPIQYALSLPSGARRVRFALQVNPHGYAEQYRGEASALHAEEYNRLLAERCVELGIEAVAITNHNHVGDIAEMSQVLAEQSITVFPGFETASSEGVHVLCVFEPGTSADTLNRYLGSFEIHETESNSDLSRKTFQEILQSVSDKNGIVIAAHASNQCGGLLKVLSGQARINAWRDENLLAIQIPGPVDDLPHDLKQIVLNKNPDYRRSAAPHEELAVAVVNAKDVKHPDDLRDPSATIQVKMASLSIEGLRQAFLDPQSRIELNSGPPAEESDVRIEAVAWGGGFLDEQALHLNENLNVLIGGRGTGKSTVIESLRFVFEREPLGKEAREIHGQILKSVLGGGARVWAKVRVTRPSPRSYVVERGVGEVAVVRTEEGEITKLRPADILGDLQIYGQHEVAELTRDKVRQTELIRRYVTSENDYAQRRDTLLEALRKNRQSLVQAQAELTRMDEKLAALPGIEETLKSFKEAGLDEKLKHQRSLIREEACLKNLLAKLEPFREAKDQLEQSLPIDATLVSESSLAELPNREILGRAREVLADLQNEATAAKTRLETAISNASGALAEIRKEWEGKKEESKAAYEKTLRELHQEKIDGSEFVRLRQRIEELSPLKIRRGQTETLIQTLMEKRRNLLIEWEGTLSEEFIELQRAAKKASRKLSDHVKLEVVKNGNRQALIDFLEQKMSGRKDQIRKAMEEEDFSLQLFSETILKGTSSIQETFGISPAQAETLNQLPLDTRLQFGEIALETTTEVSLNVAQHGDPVDWKRLQDLSKGQKATALLLLLLLDSTSPLLVDQPEDDLDNRFVTSGIVPRIRATKPRRQFVFATHNANIPVLGDAELIAVLSAGGESGYLKPEQMGAIDTPAVKELVEDLLEGGHTAFEARLKKYRF